MCLDSERFGQTRDVAEQSAVVGDQWLGFSLQFDFEIIDVAVGVAACQWCVYRTGLCAGGVVDGDDAGAYGLNLNAVERVDVALNGLFCNGDSRGVVAELNGSGLFVGQRFGGSVGGFLAGSDNKIRAKPYGAQVDHREYQEDEQDQKNHRRFGDRGAFVASYVFYVGLASCHFSVPGECSGWGR